MNRYLYFSLVWVSLFLIINIYWISQNNTPPAWDQAVYMSASESLYQTLAHQGLWSFLNNTTTVLGRLAPLVSIFPVPLFVLFGSSYQTALYSNLVWAVIFFTSFYLLVKKLLNEKLATVSVILVSTMPIFYGLARNFFVEFGLTALVTSWIYLLVINFDLTNRKLSVSLGVITGLGMLMKFHFFLFIFGPLLLASYKFIKKKGETKLLLINSFFILIPGLLIAGPWYFRNLANVLYHIKRATDPDVLKSFYYGTPFSLQTISHTILDLINFVLSGYYSLLILILIASFLYFKKKINLNPILVSWLIFPFLIFFFGPNKDYRLLLPLIPPLAVFFSQIIVSLLQNRLYLYISTFTIPIFIFVNNSLPIKMTSYPYNLGPVIISNNNLGLYIEKPQNQYWPIKEILEYLSALDPTSRDKVIISASEDRGFNINTLQYYNLKYNLPLTILTASYFYKDTTLDNVEKTINKGDYLVVKQGGIPGPYDLNSHNDEILNIIQKENWKRIPNGFVFPDGGKLSIFKNTRNEK